MMMITYTYMNEGGQVNMFDTIWYVGEKLKLKFKLSGKVKVRVQASGEELEYIKKNVSNIPIEKHSMLQVWRDSFADEIVRSLLR